MKNKTIYLLLFVILAASCSDDDHSTDERILNFEGVTDCQLGPSGRGICLEGPRTVTPGETYTYAFKISKQETGDNINQIVNWTVGLGQIEIIDIETTVMTDYTISVSTIKFGDHFNEGQIIASSDRYNIESDPLLSGSRIKYPIVKE